MDAKLKNTLKAVTLELRHLLEGRYDSEGKWEPGDLEQRLAAIGVRRDRASVPVDELRHLAAEDRQARKVIDAYLKMREEAGVERADAVADFLRETSFTWANRLLALRCMEARDLIDSVILQQEAYGGRSLEHHRLAQRRPELCAGDDDGLFAVLDKVFCEQSERLPMLFDPQAPGVALRPSPASLKDCFGLLSLNPGTLAKYRIRLKDDESAEVRIDQPNPFTAPDALGWAYQYWNTEEKVRVFEKVRTVKGAKIAGADIIPATQLYTEDYMVKFLVQNSLGATWMGMHPESKLTENWEYYVKDADRAPVDRKPVREITFLDPACGSGHFLLEAFDLFFAMYQEEGELSKPEEICDAILTKNLFGIDIDARAVQIAEVALWMKAAERALDYKVVPTNLVAATASHLKGPAWEEFLSSFEREPSVARVLRKFAQTMEHIDEIGSLARPDEDLREIIRQEHATWERQVRERKEANFLFPEIRAESLSSQLPFQEISDDEFGERLFYRARSGIDVFTERDRESGEFADQFLGRETRAGFRLVDLLGRRYDVVATNPPYMGSHKMGDSLLRRIKRLYPGFARDLYGAFFQRTGLFLNESGRAAIVTMHGFMFLSSFEEVRKFLLTDVSVELIAHLGPYAFEELGDHAPACLTLISNRQSGTTHQILFLDATAFRNKEGSLRRWETPVSQTVGVLRRLPHCRFLYTLADSVVRAFVANPHLENDGDHSAVVRRGLDTGKVARFVRCFWEVSPDDAEWGFYCKGGDTRRWYGNSVFVVRWSSHSGNRLDFIANSIIPNRDLYFSPGVTFSRSSGTGLNARYLPEDTIFGCEGPGILNYQHNVWTLLAYLGSRPVEAIASVINPSMHYQTGDVALIPLPNSLSQETTLGELGRSCHNATKEMYRNCPSDRAFDSCPLGARTLRQRIEMILAFSSVRHTLEAEIDRVALRMLGLSDGEGRTLCHATRLSAGWLPTLDAYDQLPTEVKAYTGTSCAGGEPLRSVNNVGGIMKQISKERLDYIKSKLREAFERGPGTDGSEDFEESDQDGDTCGDTCDEEETLRRPIPPQTFLEELVEIIEIHPISTYWLLKEGIEKQGWRCLPEERRLWSDQITVTVLCLLGHQWPKHIESGELIPDWADPDGIISLTPLANESILFERVQQRLTADEIDATDFIELMGKPIDSWLTIEFFKHHSKQFKHRPIAWQIQSGKFSASSSPAFACLMYYHKLDPDILHKLRSQYIGPHRQRLETELRGIMAIATEARSDRQEKRRTELEDSILELQRFDAVLETVAVSGFGPQSLASTLRQKAIDDAMSALKARWLRRLTELITKSPLPEWLTEANKTELHPDLQTWIADAMTRLDYFCASVGPKPPDQSKLVTDPTASELARLIILQADSMLKDSLKLACDSWWKQFDEVVLGPVKRQIKELKDEQKSNDEQLDAVPAPSAAEIKRLRFREKEIKQDVKVLTAQIKKRTAIANEVRAKIEGWRSEEPLGWVDWLAGQPLFDRISSLDGRRVPPTTIAEFVAQESLYAPDINDGVRVNIAPLQKAGILAADVLAKKDVDKAIADRAEWRADERRWVREGKLPQPGWWPE